MLQQLVRECLMPYCDKEHFGFFDRIKELDSFAEKLETGRFDSWDELDDLYAATIVVPSLRDEERALAAIRERFAEVRLRSRASTRTPPDVFRFDSPRFIGVLKPSPERVGSPVAAARFEVQIRTAFEHAWSTTTHALTYKSDHLDWKRLRLTSALRATVEQIDLSIAGFERTASEVLPGKWDESELKLKILERFKALFGGGHLPSELKPQAWSRFVENMYSLCDAEAKRRRDAKHIRKMVEEVVEDVLSAFEAWAHVTESPMVPRSLSLFQTSFGVLCRTGVLGKGIDFAIFGVADLVAVFPEAEGVSRAEVQ